MEKELKEWCLILEDSAGNHLRLSEDQQAATVPTQKNSSQGKPEI